MFPGTAKTVLPCSRAWAAVLREPDFSAASTITAASERPEIRRLRSKKLVLAKILVFGSTAYLGEEKDRNGIYEIKKNRGIKNE